MSEENNGYGPALVLCPLVDEEIDAFVCMETSEIAEHAIPERFRAKPDWKTICQNCQWHNY